MRWLATGRERTMLSQVLSCAILAFLPMLAIVAAWSQQEGSESLSANVSVAANGTFLCRAGGLHRQANSRNGVFWCRYQVGSVGDEVRQLKRFQLFADDHLLYTREKVPGCDVYISNLGITAFMDMNRHHLGQVTVNFFSPEGQFLFSKTFQGAWLFGFSTKGNQFGVGTSTEFQVITIPDGGVETYQKGFQFDISADGSLLAIASPDWVRVYAGGELVRAIRTGLPYTRKVSISLGNDRLSVVDKRTLKVYNLFDGGVAFADTLRGRMSYRDVVWDGGRVLTGIHWRGKGVSKGLLRIYGPQGEVVAEREDAIQEIPAGQRPERSSPDRSRKQQIPWPFLPFDQMHTIWNYYEQHMGGSANWSYLHQGLDIITAIGEHTFAVADGVVKCVLTTGGAAYWRIAVGREQTSEPSEGWLYAHLIEHTIQFDVGDTVRTHDYLGDVIQWEDDWGHLHFVEIRDSGTVWRYDDDEWGITHNPLVSLRPNTDSFSPIIEDVFPGSKFAFCRNETSLYLDPDSLHGDIDIIAKVKDYVGSAGWEQPAYETYYWVREIPGGTLVHPRTMGQRLNHAYDFYRSTSFEPYATLIYKRDELLLPTNWLEMQRNYYHILTNNNGDSLAELGEKELAFPTADYLDGAYRIFIEARDEYGNSTVDSMDVAFGNGMVAVGQCSQSRPVPAVFTQNYPNPFNPTTTIVYSVPEAGIVTLEVYDILGNRVRTLIQEFQEVGAHSAVFHAQDLASGVYLSRLQVGGTIITRKMLLLR